MGNDKRVLTTGEVARICNVAPRTVSKWFDTGQLKGYRIPGGKDRRIPVDHLRKFMVANGIPTDALEGKTKRILVVDDDREAIDALSRSLAGLGSFEVVAAESAFEAGVAAQECLPHAIVINVDLADVSPAAIVSTIRSSNSLCHTKLIGTGRGLSEPQGQSLLQAGFHAYLAKPFDMASLLSRIENGAVGAHRNGR